MSADRERNKRASQRATDTAIDYAPLEEILGDKVARKYQIRELTTQDGAYMHERASKRIKSMQRRTWCYAVTVVHVDRPRIPLFSLISSKTESASKTLTIYDTHAELEDIDDELAGHLVHVVLLTAQSYAYLADAKTMKVKDTGDARLQEMLRKSGYDVSKREKGLLYGVRKVLTTLTPLTAHH